MTARSLAYHGDECGTMCADRALGGGCKLGKDPVFIVGNAGPGMSTKLLDSDPGLPGRCPA